MFGCVQNFTIFSVKSVKNINHQGICVYVNEDFKNRINYEGDIEVISKLICIDYSLGNFLSNKVVLLGYEDFNVILETSKGKYFVKIFANFRNENHCKRYIDIILSMVNNGVATPKIFKSKQGFFHQITIDACKLRLCVLEYIKGSNLYDSNEKLSVNEIKFLAKQAALINTIDLKPEFVYDTWAISNFEKEFEKKLKYLSHSDSKLVENLLQEFNNLQSDKLPHCFVHGDIINTNVIKDKNSNLFIIDFSVSNIYPRIQELAVLACNILFDSENIKNTNNNLSIALEEYQKHIKLTEQELNVLPIYIKLAHAMHLLSANYEKFAKNNNSKENDYWLNLGRTGLKQFFD